MNATQFLSSAWTWNPVVLAACGAAGLLGVWYFGTRARWGYWALALVVIVFTLCSPLNALADGYLFSAHMTQHILLLLVAPLFLVLGLPRDAAVPAAWRKAVHPVLGWAAGVGAMWLWHAPALCNAAVSSRPIYALQTLSLLGLGALFWWQVQAPRYEQRLTPLTGVVYLFSACFACSLLGIIVTFSPVAVCSIYCAPVDRLGILPMLRRDWGFSPERDQQVGGLLMWVPMCGIYLGAIFAQLARWYSHTETPTLSPPRKA